MVFDLLAKYLRSRGYKIYYLMNVTNVDDKIIARAKEKNESPQELADEFEALFFKNMDWLGIDSVNTYARATDHIKEVIGQVKTLIKRGNAYEIPGDPSTGQAGGWYFDLTSFKNYGKLSHRSVAGAEDGVSRIDESIKKKNTGDFCLWKFSRSPEDLPTFIHEHHSKGFRIVDGEPSWETALGWGRPGWHIEDTAISEHYFGPQYDIHGGGIDLKFPHHEAEIAQQESASRKAPFVRYWVHSGALTVNGAKMSKSLNNFVTIEDLLKNYTGQEFRMFTLMHHYRSPVDYNTEALNTARKHLADIQVFLAKLDLMHPKKTDSSLAVNSFAEKYYAVMDDDFNSPGGLGVLFGLMNEVNPQMFEISRSQAKQVKQFLLNALTGLGFTNLELKIDSKVLDMAKDRELSRVNKQFNQSDELRKKIEALGYTVEDTPAGPLVLPR